MTRDIAIAGRLLRGGGLLALLFGLSVWAAAVSYGLFGMVWQGAQKTAAFFATVGHEVRDVEIFNEQASSMAQATLASSVRPGGVTQSLTERILKPLLAMPEGTAKRVVGAGWDDEFQIVKLADIAPERAEVLARLTLRLMNLDANFWSALGGQDETFIISADGAFAAYRTSTDMTSVSADGLAQDARSMLSEINKVERYAARVHAGQDGPFWTYNYQNVITHETVVSSFVPIRDLDGHLMLYVGTSMAPDRIIPPRLRTLEHTGEALQLVSPDGFVVASAGASLSPLGPLRTIVTLPMFGDAQMVLRHDGERVVFERHLASSPWFVRYAVRPVDLLQQSATLLIGATLLLFLYAAGIYAGMRYMRQRIIEPARRRTTALLERDAFTQTLIETAPVGMAIIDPFEPAMVMSNPAYAGTVDLLRHLGDGELARMYRQLHSGVVARPVRRLLSALDDAGERHYAVSFVDTVFREQPVLIGTLSDVTEQRRFELEQRKARLAAESANRAKDVFLTTVSHEMRTPLYGTLASIELLSAQNLGDDHRYYVDVMESSTRNLLDLINDLLDYSRIQVGRFELNSRDCSLLKELEAVGLSFTGRARLQGLTLDWMIDPQLSRAVHTDALRLGQVVTNLVGNAIKFTEKGHVAFSAMVSRADAQGCDVVFTVSDSGVGIASADLADLFRPFGKSTNEPGMQHGTGLGLAISHQFVGMLGGALQVESQEGAGTTMRFTLHLPWAPDSTAVLAPATGETFAYVSGLVRRHWYLDALIRRAGYTPVRYDDAVAWSSGSGRMQDAGLLMFADEWPVRGMAGAEVYLLRATPVDRLSGSAPVWPRDIALFQQAELWDALGTVTSPGDAESELTASGGGSARTRVKPLAGWYVLVADDHPISGMLLSRQLEGLGAMVDCYHDPREALDAFDAESHMLVITDANMPHLSGHALATEIKARAPHVPVVVATADVTLRHDREADSPFDAVVYKPVDARSLLRVIELVRGRYPSLCVEIAPLPASSRVLEGDATAPPDTTSTKDWRLPLPEMLDTFVKIADQDIANCRTALAELSRDELRHSAHRLRGGFMAFGLSPLASLAAQVEHLAPQASAGQMEAAFDALDAAWNDWLRAQGQAIASDA
ncbi:response regulator [Pandoraea fibrosis]|uniref:histidine kinase n=1 Tax=Pandoraea fibrosis TaxID=1891094 RepID=A0ABX6HS33_9BURK|nr:hybrid sensor histidine kinase/response regulator [Pandoraea fibrosis]QHE92725.1 response regulator [Pandoraea fibrosis]QHF13718.1 response regulator [Pandoraea fibrosis]